MFFTRQIRLGVLLLAFAVFLSWSGARSLVVVHGKILLVFCGSRSLEALDPSSSRLCFFGGIFLDFFSCYCCYCLRRTWWKNMKFKEGCWQEKKKKRC